jgi:sugar-specific transcriptional regulator TrmB
VYITLVTKGNLGISTLSKLSELYRTDAYRVIRELENKGLVERILVNPTLFKAIPLEESISILLQRRVKKERQLRQKALKLKLGLSKETKRKQVVDASQFVLVPARRVMDRIVTAVDQTQKSADLVLSNIKFVRGISAFFDKMEKSWNRGVKWRIAVCREEKEDETFWNNINFCKRKLSQIKFIACNPLEMMGIYDQKETFIVKTLGKGLAESPALWSNNPALIRLASDHFEKMWSQEIEYQNLQIHNQKNESNLTKRNRRSGDNQAKYAFCRTFDALFEQLFSQKLGNSF